MTRDTVSLRDIQQAIRELREELLEPIKDHERRLREHEAFRNRIYGIALLFATVPSLILNFIWNEVVRK